MNSFYPSNRQPLPPSAFAFLPLGAVKPIGWLKDQLRIQADGQSGNLPKFWESLSPNSGWRGGTGEGWERGPYFLDGYLPMAYLLDDEDLQKEAQQWIEYALNSQDAFGHFGPRASSIDWWPFAIILKVLTQYHEVSGDERVIPLMQKFFKYMKNEMPTNHWYSWAWVRWADMVLSIKWLYNRTGEKWLLELADKIHRHTAKWSDGVP
ncbi:MAG: beta-L-arabinofuranosidase domain-containing protein, partial [Armatimonadota bacterium]